MERWAAAGGLIVWGGTSRSVYCGRGVMSKETSKNIRVRCRQLFGDGGLFNRLLGRQTTNVCLFGTLLC